MINIAGSGTVKIYLGNYNNWDENSLTQFNSPAGQQEQASVNGQFSPEGIYEFDVAAAVAANGIYTFLVIFESACRRLEFSSCEGTFPPKLLIATLRGAGVAKSDKVSWMVI